MHDLYLWIYEIIVWYPDMILSIVKTGPIQKTHMKGKMVRGKRNIFGWNDMSTAVLGEESDTDTYIRSVCDWSGQVDLGTYVLGKRKYFKISHL